MSLNLLELLLSISFFDINFAGRGKFESCLKVFVAVTITSFNSFCNTETTFYVNLALYIFYLPVDPKPPSPLFEVLKTSTNSKYIGPPSIETS